MIHRNYKILHNNHNYCLIGDLSSSDKFHFYYKYKSKSVNVGKRRRTVFIVIGIALMFLTLFFKITIPEYHDTLYDKYFTPYSESNITRSEIQDNRLQKVQLFIEYKDYDNALNILNKYNNKDMSAHFYLGMLYQRKGNYRRAILEYNKIINNNNNLFVEQSHWYIGLCYIKIDDKDNAVKHLKILANKHDGYYMLISKTLLNEMIIL